LRGPEAKLALEENNARMSDALPKVGRKITKGGRDFGKFMAQCTRGVIENTKDAWELHSLVI